MRPISLVLAVALVTPFEARQPETSQPAVVSEFRVFAGREEITQTTALRVAPTGVREGMIAVGPARRLTVSLSPGIYDVQAFRTRGDAVVSIKSVERVIVMNRPDEGGRHLEVINFQPGFGALRVRSQKNPIANYVVDVFPAGDRTAAVAKPHVGEDSMLFILEARRYDLRVRPTGARDNVTDTNWTLWLGTRSSCAKWNSKGRSSSVIHSLSDTATSLSIRFSSSRIFPGHQ
jgi:hypothetical protein